MSISNEKFFREKILSHQDYLRKYLRAALCKDELLEDILQETMVRAWEKIHILKTYKDIRKALKVMATNIFINHKGSSKNRVQALEQSFFEKDLTNDKDNLLLLLDLENRRRVLAAIGELNEPSCNIILLKYYYNIPFTKISDLLDMNYNTVLSHHRRALVRLNKILSP